MREKGGGGGEVSGGDSPVGQDESHSVLRFYLGMYITAAMYIRHIHLVKPGRRVAISEALIHSREG